MLRIILYGFRLDDYLIITQKLNNLGISVTCAKDVNRKVKTVLRLGDRKFVQIDDEPIIVCDGFSSEEILKLFSKTHGLIKFGGIIGTVTSENCEWKVKKLIHSLKNEKEAINKIEILKTLLNKLEKIDISQASESEIEYLDKWITKAHNICKYNITNLDEINVVSSEISKILKNYHI